MLHILATLALAARVGTVDTDSTELRGEALISALRTGGYTILLRHARTDRSVQEPRNYEGLPRSVQRNLTDDGVRDAALIGLVMRKYAVPVGEILSSPVFRTLETAQYAFGEPKVVAELRHLEASDAQRAVVAATPGAGTNRVLVTHHFIIERYAPGIRPGDIDESEAAVVRTTSDGAIRLVGRFKLADWEALARPAGAPATSSTPSADGGATPHGTVRTFVTHGPASGSATIPNSPTGELARGYLHAFNSGDESAMQAFIERRLVTDPNRPMAARLETYRKLHADHGPISVTSVVSSTEAELVLGARSKQGDFMLIVRAAPGQPGRAESVGFGRRH